MTPDEKTLRDPDKTDAEKARILGLTITAIKTLRARFGISAYYSMPGVARAKGKPAMVPTTVRLKRVNLEHLRKHPGGVGAAINDLVDEDRRKS